MRPAHTFEGDTPPPLSCRDGETGADSGDSERIGMPPAATNFLEFASLPQGARTKYGVVLRGVRRPPLFRAGWRSSTERSRRDEGEARMRVTYRLVATVALVIGFGIFAGL